MKVGMQAKGQRKEWAGLTNNQPLDSRRILLTI
jgi:hypothetical protein